MIVNYDTYVDRVKEEPISLADYNMHLKFFFMSPSGNPVPLRPEIGKFVLQSTSYSYFDGKYSENRTNVEIEEIDFIKKNYPEIKWYNGTPARGVYTAKNHSDLLL